MKIHHCLCRMPILKNNSVNPENPLISQRDKLIQTTKKAALVRQPFSILTNYSAL